LSGLIRSVATELAVDIVVTVGDVKFYLHKFPLLSKSSRLQTLVASTSEEGSDEVDISDIPGGPAAFEVCAKFCYGMVVTLNAYNVLAARCAAEYLEMSETVEKGNLVYKIDVFLSASIFRAWKDSIIVLQSTRPLQRWTDSLKVVNHCVDAIASRASTDPSEVDWSYTYSRRKLPSETDGDARGWNGVRKRQAVPRDWWVEDLCDLEVCLYRKVILAIKAKGRTGGAVVGEALRAYACRRLFGSLDHAVSDGLDCTKHRAALEAVADLLPAEKGSVSCGLLLKLLRASCLLESGQAYRGELIRRIGAQLERASVPDLLIPADSGDGDGDAMYNVGMVAAMLEEFLLHHKVNGAEAEKREDGEDDVDVAADDPVTSSKLAAVAKLVDGYLSEIAKDPCLPLETFVALAESMPPLSRPVHDALYRAIDVYLKEHPGMSKGEKKRLCALMDCRKLTADASEHAVQNERLPLRVVVQVLFFEQVRQSAAAAAASAAPARSLILPRDDGASYGSSRSATTTATEDEQWGGGAVVGAPVTTSTSGGAGDAGSLRSVSQLSANENGRSGGGGDRKKAKGGAVAPAPVKRVLGKLWSGKASSGSDDTSASPVGSLNLEPGGDQVNVITYHEAFCVIVTILLYMFSLFF
ncbi:hypothetical protein Zm00014a_021206, partial [Zea mays]